MRRAETLRVSMLEPVFSAFRGSGLGVLVALQFFDGADWQKALLGSVGTVGLLLCPCAVGLARRTKAPVSRVAGALTILAAPGLLVATLAPSLWVFMLGIFLSIPMVASAMPLITAMWQQNAPPKARGRTMSHVIFVGGLSTTVITVLISLWLGSDPGRFRPVTACFVLMVVVAGAAIARVPSRPLEPSRKADGHQGISFLKLLWHDKLFGYLCIAQMLIGFSNLATIPLRTEFLGSDQRGMGYVASLVFLLTTVVPAASRFLSVALWGRLFDRLNFAVMRGSVTLCFVVSLATSFSPILALQIMGAVFFGIGMGGGAIAWALWVTKLAPAEKTADYMGVHTFLTGVRGLIGPQVAFLLLARMSIAQVGMAGALMALSAVIMMIPIIPRFQNREHA